MGGLRYAIWAFAAGSLIPVMGVLSARLGRSIGEPVHAAVVLFGVAFLLSLLLSVALTGRLPPLGVLRGDPLVDPLVDRLAGAVLVFYVLSITFLAPRFGIGNSILFAVSAQLVTSAVLDHFGLFGAPQRPVGALRLAGIALMVVGIAVAQLAARTATEAR